MKWQRQVELVMVLCMGLALGCQDSATRVEERWDLVASYDQSLGDTVEIERGTRILDLHEDGSFNAKSPDESVDGTFTVDRREEPRFGNVQMIEFSRRVEFLGHSSEFIVEMHGDTLRLINPWTDSRSHLLVRSPP